MKSEELLKSISDMLKKHKDFLNANSDIFYAIEDRLYKAVDEDEREDEKFSDMFDEVPEDKSYDEDTAEFQDIEEDDADKWIAEQETKQVDKPKEEPKRKTSASGYRDWTPKDEYKPEHQETMDKLREEGWSHREAERLVGQHQQGGDPRYSKVRPSEPSAKMFESVKGQAGDYLRNYERNISASADARKNPVKFANAQNRQAHEAVHGDFDEAFTEFKNSDDVKNLRGRDRHNAIKGFKSKWHEDNPEHREKAVGVAAVSSGSFDRAKEERTEHLEEGEKAIAQAGMVNVGSSVGEFSSAAAGGEEMTRQGALQSVGGTQTEGGGYSAGTIKDPSLHIAEQYPEYAQYLKDKHQKLNDSLKPEQATRLKGIQGIKNKKGNE